MILRVYLKPDAPDAKGVVSDIDAKVRAIGDVSKRKSSAYWKMPELTEEKWVFSPHVDPDWVLSQLMEQLGSGWHVTEDDAILAELADGVFEHPGVRDIFLEIEYIDRGRAVGVLPKYEFEQEVIVIASKGPLASYSGRRAAITGHAFDEQSRRWSYAIRIEGVSHVWCAGEVELGATDD